MEAPADYCYLDIAHRHIGAEIYFVQLLHDTVLLGVVEMGFPPHQPFGCIGRYLNYWLFSRCHAGMHMRQSLGRNPGNPTLGHILFVSIHSTLRSLRPAPEPSHATWQ